MGQNFTGILSSLTGTHTDFEEDQKSGSRSGDGGTTNVPRVPYDQRDDLELVEPPSIRRQELPLTPYQPRPKQSLPAAAPAELPVHNSIRVGTQTAKAVAAITVRSITGLTDYEILENSFHKNVEDFLFNVCGLEVNNRENEARVAQRFIHFLRGLLQERCQTRYGVNFDGTREITKNVILDVSLAISGFLAAGDCSVDFPADNVIGDHLEKWIQEGYFADPFAHIKPQETIPVETGDTLRFLKEMTETDSEAPQILSDTMFTRIDLMQISQYLLGVQGMIAMKEDDDTKNALMRPIYTFVSHRTQIPPQDLDLTQPASALSQWCDKVRAHRTFFDALKGFQLEHGEIGELLQADRVAFTRDITTIKQGLTAKEKQSAALKAELQKYEQEKTQLTTDKATQETLIEMCYEKLSALKAESTAVCQSISAEMDGHKLSGIGNIINEEQEKLRTAKTFLKDISSRLDELSGVIGDLNKELNDITSAIQQMRDKLEEIGTLIWLGGAPTVKDSGSTL